MRAWKLRIGDPLALTLAVDARLDPVDYINDHIWELSLGSGEPLALSIQTTFGLRARAMRIFPWFSQENRIVTNPAAFYQPPFVSQFFPNLIRLSYSPYNGIDVISEYWVPLSQVLTCRTTITNKSIIPINLNSYWAAVLNPMDDGVGMTLDQDKNIRILHGSSSGLVPVFYLSENP